MMGMQWSRLGPGLRLLLAIFADLGRRAWWAYRAHGLHTPRPHTTLVAPRPAEARPYAPLVTPAWRAVAARALPVQAIAKWQRDAESLIPVVWIDVADRPDVADLPRVLEMEQGARDARTLAATQWLADQVTQHAVLVVTFVEPVATTWALSFDLRRWATELERFDAPDELLVTWGAPPPAPDTSRSLLVEPPSAGLLLSLNRPYQLRAILRLDAARRSTT
jgi:hypothetical protein